MAGGEGGFGEGGGGGGRIGGEGGREGGRWCLWWFQEVVVPR